VHGFLDTEEVSLVLLSASIRGSSSRSQKLRRLDEAKPAHATAVSAETIFAADLFQWPIEHLFELDELNAPRLAPVGPAMGDRIHCGFGQPRVDERHMSRRDSHPHCGIWKFHLRQLKGLKRQLAKRSGWIAGKNVV
jgi:hypothetical protein